MVSTRTTGQPTPHMPVGTAVCTVGSDRVSNMRVATDWARTIHKPGMAKADGEHKFWNTQPVRTAGAHPCHGLHFVTHSTHFPGERSASHGPIEAKTLDDVQREPYALPVNFKWVDCDVEDAKEARRRPCPGFTALRRRADG